MENIPPIDWHKIATKDDLNTLAVVIGAEFTAVRGEFDKQIAGQTRTMVMWFVGIAATIATSAVAVCVTLVTQL